MISLQGHIPLHIIHRAPALSSLALGLGLPPVRFAYLEVLVSAPCGGAGAPRASPGAVVAWTTLGAQVLLNQLGHMTLLRQHGQERADELVVVVCTPTRVNLTSRTDKTTCKNNLKCEIPEICFTYRLLKFNEKLREKHSEENSRNT